MKYKQTILLIYFSILITCNVKEESSELETLPNIVLIYTDDQGYNDLGVYGSPDILTPNLDQLAQEGMRFTNFYVAQAVCSASRAALLTGTYPNRIGIHGALDHSSRHGLNPEEVTIAKMLKPKGYQTAIFGKWHLGHYPEFLPTNHGFDEFFGIPYSNDMWPYHPETKDYYPPLPLYENEKVVDTLHTDQSMLTTWLTERAISFIEKNREKPFFLYLPHPMPHVPLFVSEKFEGKSERGLYGDVIMELDWSVGEIVKSIREKGLEENTLIIFLSDNGPWLSYSLHAGSAYPLKEGKGTSWDGGVKVPAIFKWPGKIPAQSVQKHPAMNIDILPTIAAVTGAGLPENHIDGMEITSMWKNTASKSPQEAYFIYYNRNDLQAVLMDEWKLVLPHSYRSLKEGQSPREDGMPLKYEMRELSKPELYHIAKDQSESTNVIEDYPDIYQKMLDLAEHARKDLGDALTEKEGVNLRKPGTID
ncbi:sulfatase family protein [Arthrospiribacter ruber]|uniref:Arylsulfatase n=1 Tax=Arthrospiribacter ruber TaxID=2487934 RepID=A0A951MCT0_9BACT|nr:sulfatase [Arthrospiribacter ruber]MBW3468234.1 arylsulfatase [Arthrospiribacter ruber]